MLRLLGEISAPTFWLPERASVSGGGTDGLFYFIYWLSVFFTVLIFGMGIIFVLKYRHKPGRKADPAAGHSTALELTWTIIPTILVIIIYYYGFRGFLNLAVEPPNAYEITATGQMWSWSFRYPNGYVDTELHVPANMPVRLVLESKDVIHGLFIPAMRAKKDVVPGRFNRLWFQAEKKPGDQPDRYDIYCTNYCGMNHSTMLSKAYVHTMDDSPQGFRKWLEDASALGEKLSPIEWGERIYKTRGCMQCHLVDGKVLTGPSWKDMFGSQVPLSGGATVTADENYVHESILDPQAKIHAGFQPVMPSYKGQLKEEEISAVIAYMKSISSNFKGDLAPLKKVGALGKKAKATTQSATTQEATTQSASTQSPTTTKAE